MTHLGDGHHGKKNAECPFCQAKGGTWSVYEKNGRYLFKCHNAKPVCVANETAPDVGHGEIGYLVLRKGYSVDEAKEEYLNLAVPHLLEEFHRKQRKEGDIKRTNAPVAIQSQESTSDSAQHLVSNAAPTVQTAGAAPKEPSDLSVPPNPPKPPAELPAEPPPDQPLVWDALWRRLVLTPRDRTKLMQQRGFSEETIKILGFKSNNQSNLVHLKSLTDDYPMELLLAEGIYKIYRDGPGPNRQLYGWGLKRKARKEGDDDTWDWVEPILIPYLTASGACSYLRPHKGGVSGERREDEDDEEASCSAHVYSPFLLSNTAATIEGTAILCEGEFKAAAVYQCGIPSLAIPGISFVRNRAFREELLALIRTFGVTDLIICFDNEIKDDPAFPDRYKPDPTDRYDTQMWAEYIAIDLTREYFGPNKGRVTIGILPDNLHENGKADFDSALSYFVRQQRDVTRGTNSARKIFKSVIDDARPHRQARELFPSESRRIIEWKLQRLFYKPLVPSGGEKELRLANQYKAIGEHDLSKAYRSIVGCYYQRVKPERDQIKMLLEAARKSDGLVDNAKAAGVNGSELRKLRLNARAAWDHVKGAPEPVSDFVLTCEFKLHTSDQKAIRLVKIRNRNDSGKSEGRLLRLTGAEMARGPEFMRWCYDTGHACWKGGQRLLSHLCEDMDHHSYLRDIFEINYYGYHAESGIWFFGDCAFGPNGDRIEADKNNIFWNAGIGYQIDSSIEDRGTTFEQGAPLMLSPHGAVAKDAKVDVGELLQDLCHDMLLTIGGYDAWFMLGLVFAYAASPELFTKFGGHPSIWLAGITSEGKTTIARWIMRVWGFKHLTGIRINKGTTHVAMNRNLAQYSCLPVWFDEYRKTEIDPDKEAVLRGAFDRNSASKGLMDHSNRTRSARLFTTPIVSGESSSSDGATRSRYANIIVSKHRRIGDGVARMRKVIIDAEHYYLIGRRLMESRPKFVAEVIRQINEFMADPAAVKEVPDDRMRLVYAAGYAAFRSTSELIKGPGFDERQGCMDNFRAFLLQHAAQALQDVTSETFLNHFWSDVLSGLQRGKAKRAFFDIRYVQRQEDGSLKEIRKDDKTAEKVCYIAPKSVFDDYAQDLRARGESPSLDLGDLRRQMAKEKYWVAAPKAEPRVHRAMVNGAQQTCWVISLGRNGTGTFLFPFAEDLEQIIEPLQAEEEPSEDSSHGSPADEDSVNNELLGGAKNSH